MSRPNTAASLLACLILAVATLRAITFWAADPMLAYGNNFDQIRTLKVFGLHPKDSPNALYEMTPDRPYRFFIQSDTPHAPIYPSADLLIKFIQVGTMAAFRSGDGLMDIKIATAPVLVGWLACIWQIFRRLLARPLAAVAFAIWVLLVTDPINLLFLNTWYAEFSAFAVATLFVGIAWLWLFQLTSLRWSLVWGGVCLAVLSLNRNQYMFLLPAVAGLVGAVLILSRPYPYQSPSATTSVKWILIGVACLLPMVIYHTAAQKNAEVSLWAATNRVNTVFGALVPASKDPAKMLKRMGLPPEGCMRFSEKTLFLTPQDEFNAYCPKSLTLPLHQIATAVLLEPAVLVAIVKTIAVHHSGFLQHHIGHVESANNGYIDHADQSNFDGAAFRTSREWTPLLTSQPYYGQSIDPLFRRISANSVMLLIWFVALGPALAALAAWAMKQRRWAFMFLLSGLLFNYALFSSILGDGYFELERHAILCFSFGALFFVLVGSWAAHALSARRSFIKGTPD